jgi:arsenite methyltransferase
VSRLVAAGRDGQAGTTRCSLRPSGVLDQMTPSSTARADYGLDAPGVIAAMSAIAVVLMVASVLLLLRHASHAMISLGASLAWPGASFALAAILMVLSSQFGKLRARDRLLDRLALAGDEQLLDIGCGHGLLLIGAAHRLPRGRAVGLDLWSQKDQLANRATATMANASAEGVQDRVRVQDGDMRVLPFADASMDVVVSSLAIHNVPGAADRARAIAEIARVVKPGGRVALLDIAHVGTYARQLRDAGWIIEHEGYTPWIFPPTRELCAVKPTVGLTA